MCLKRKLSLVKVTIALTILVLVVVLRRFRLDDVFSVVGKEFIKSQSLCPPPPPPPLDAWDEESRRERSTVIQQSTPCYRCNGRHPDDGRWFNFSTASFHFYAYTAFYDERPREPVVRIAAVSNTGKQMPVYCVLRHKYGSNVTTMEENPLPIGTGRNLLGKYLVEHIYTCPTGGTVPFAVSIIDDPRETIASCMPVETPLKPKTRKEFAVCVNVAYWYVDPYRLIEWMEIQKLLGVSLVGATALELNETSLRVLRHYDSEGFLELRQTNPIVLDGDRHHRRLHGTIIINDCLLRHMYEFDWIVVVDFDEIIMPRKHSNLHELVSYLEGTISSKRQPLSRQNTTDIGGKQRLSSFNITSIGDASPLASSYVFRNNYFFLDLAPDATISPYFTVLRYRKKVPVSGHGYSVKSIVNPRACTNMHCHYCWGWLKEEEDSKHIVNVDVDPEIGLNQHYKKCHFTTEECRSLLEAEQNDDVMLRLKDALTVKVRERINVIMKHDI